MIVTLPCSVGQPSVVRRVDISAVASLKQKALELYKAKL